MSAVLDFGLFWAGIFLGVVYFSMILLPLFYGVPRALVWAFRGWSLETHWERGVTFYRFSKGHWKHLRTTNPIESPFAAARLRTDAAKRFRQVKNAIAVIWKMLLVAERGFRRVKHPELIQKVYRGDQYVGGLRVNTESPPDSFYTPIDKALRTAPKNRRRSRQ